MFCVNGAFDPGSGRSLLALHLQGNIPLDEYGSQPVLCRASDILDAINECYRDEVNIDEVMTHLDVTGIEVVQARVEKDISEISEMAEGSPVISLTNMILLKAIRDGASDIHLEPQPGKFQVRIRIDGLLYELMSPKIEMHRRWFSAAEGDGES